MANSLDPGQTAPIGAVCSGSTMFASILNSSIIRGNYLQQPTSADDVSVQKFNECIVCSKTCLKRTIKKKTQNWFSRPIIA